MLSGSDQARGGALHTLVAESSNRKMRFVHVNVHTTLDALRRYENSRNATTRSIFVGGGWIDDDVDRLFASWFRTFKAAQTRAPLRAALPHNLHHFPVVKCTCDKSDRIELFH